tara:strand:+ start:1625 stop:1819 length:195 start_codon:yes stop_codon:yes gene_type:complete
VIQREIFSRDQPDNRHNPFLPTDAESSGPAWLDVTGGVEGIAGRSPSNLLDTREKPGDKHCSEL